jgi:16S rRNA processing protein RimM
MNRVALAAVAGAHGIKGEVRLKLFAASADSLKQARRLFVGGAERKLASLNAAGKLPVARFEGVSDRSAAEALRGSLIEVDRADLPALDDGEYYFADLVGLACVDGEGKTVGIVASVENFGAGDLLEVELPDGRKSLIPYRPGIADLEGDRIVLDPEFLA